MWQQFAVLLALLTFCAAQNSLPFCEPEGDTDADGTPVSVRLRSYIYTTATFAPLRCYVAMLVDANAET